MGLQKLEEEEDEIDDQKAEKIIKSMQLVASRSPFRRRSAVSQESVLAVWRACFLVKVMLW